MTGKPIQPPSVHPDDEPLVSICINEQWIPYLIGMVWPARYPEYWGGTLEENRQARKDVLTLMAMLGSDKECSDMNNCCVDPVIIYKVDPTTGQVVQSTDNGTTWTPSSQNLSSVIVTPVPPVTSGVADNKCDAAQNVATQIDEWITQVGNDFDTATTLLEFGIAVCEAILAAVLVILSAGLLTPIEALILPTLGAALAACWGVGKTVFNDYWTDDVKKTIRCAFYHHIGTNGSFSDAQFSAAWNELNASLPASPAKMLFMGFLSSSGTAGVNAMAASGKSHDSDCSECNNDCMTDFTFYGCTAVQNPDDSNDWMLTATGGGVHVAFSSGDSSQGCYCTPNQLESWSWWPVGSPSPVGGTNPRLTAVWNMDAGAQDAGTVIHLTFSSAPIT